MGGGRGLHRLDAVLRYRRQPLPSGGIRVRRSPPPAPPPIPGATEDPRGHRGAPETAPDAPAGRDSQGAGWPRLWAPRGQRRANKQLGPHDPFGAASCRGADSPSDAAIGCAHPGRQDLSPPLNDRQRPGPPARRPTPQGAALFGATSLHVPTPTSPRRHSDRGATRSSHREATARATPPPLNSAPRDDRADPPHAPRHVVQTLRPRCVIYDDSQRSRAYAAPLARWAASRRAQVSGFKHSPQRSRRCRRIRSPNAAATSACRRSISSSSNSKM